MNLCDKYDCCGCAACVQACPKQCIRLAADEEGFLYPTVDEASCVQCGKCLKVCPMRQASDSRAPVGVYAAANPDEEVRLRSSSGGVFSLLSEYVIRQDGVVFGAAFNERLEVVHCHTEIMEEVAAFRGSKYVQSQIGTSFQDADNFLKIGRKVLFSGTPCQIAGLKSYLGKEYPGLLTVDFVCHGVPSPGIFKEYVEAQPDFVSGVNFRDKRCGWKNFSITMDTSAGEKSKVFNNDEYMQGFLGNAFLRPSCYRCRFRTGRSCSDFTIGDFWGIDKLRPEMDDDKGLSLVIANNNEADSILKTLECSLTEMPLDDAVKYNPSINSSVAIPPYRHLFFWTRKHFGLMTALRIFCGNTIPSRAIRKACRLLTHNDATKL